MIPRGMRNVLVALLTLSVIFSIIILAFDGLLWFDNPRNGHAYALVGFTIIDVALLGLIFGKPATSVTAILIWSILKFLMMAANPLTGPLIGLTPTEFALYLYGITPFAGSEEVSCPFECPPFRYSFLILLVIQIALIASAWRARRPSSKAI